jgi:hypothetical protein
MKKEQTQNVDYYAIVLWILLGVLFFLWISGFFSEDIEEYEFCIEDCSSENEWCISHGYEIATNGFEYIRFSDAKRCSFNLESCISYCKP